jgi:malonyl-CoA reductase/3-hydroxypropionate dehydrogenase (NADP+)
VTLKTFGRVDYLINCAGIAGAEEMVIDMPLDAWRRTLDANLISNYALIQRLAYHMKQRGAGYVINVSSYFGGERYVSIPYPNRSDYATSKAGQRAMAENLGRRSRSTRSRPDRWRGNAFAALAAEPASMRGARA